ncbi:PIG-L deacetylase family protein [Sphingobium cloacae]|uniref:LmbE family protein n=1 Tax=Sphingobium cloacae TaxID=120107 RepID=A0A1E1F548_9SPHN|nr:PIG-L deacetylase family protein [Sphingobium cloacae]BAV65650.1 LmbE family protein [Sphingobium cloacae]
MEAFSESPAHAGLSLPPHADAMAASPPSSPEGRPAPRRSLIGQIEKALVIAPHPDDEVLGVGGTMARLARQGADVQVCILTRGDPPRFPAGATERVRRESAVAHRNLSVTQTHFCDLPAAELDRVPHAEMNARIGAVIDRMRPDALFVPFVGDIHLDHQLAFISALVAARPRHGQSPGLILAYETLSETNWYAPGVTPAFVPNVFVDISETLEIKLEAFAAYESQVKAFPDERSIEALRALAKVRGASVFREAAEAFMLVRQIA